MLVKHAQEQLDRGALLEAEGQGPSLVSGVKISTYFALLIRPYYGQATRFFESYMRWGSQ